MTGQARVLLSIPADPGVRIRDIADRVDLIEPSAYGIVTDLATAGYVVERKGGRRNRYQIQAHMPLPEPPARNPPSAKSSLSSLVPT